MPGIRVQMGNRMVSAKVYARQRRKMLRKQARGARKYSKNPLVATIQKVIRGQQETKYVANAYDAVGAALPTLWYSNGQLNAVGNFYPAIPQLGQGNDDYQRVGSKVEPVGCSVSLRIGFNPQDLSANSLYGVIYYGTDRANRTWANQNPLATAAILDNGDGANTIWSGTRYDLMKPIDKKLVNAKRIVFRLSKTAGIQNSDVALGAAEGGTYSTANGMQCKNFLLRFKAPKHLVYNLPGDTYPQNYAPWYAVGFCHADGSPLTVNDKQLVNVSSKCHLYFKDS